MRSFIAVPIPQPLRQQIAKLQQQLHRLVPQLKIPPATNLHLTLHFLGDQSQEQLAEIGQVMLSIGQKKKVFNVMVEGLGFFPDQQQPRILWLGLKPENGLNELYQQLANSLNKRGLTTEQRRYRPHLTIGRFQQPTKNSDQLCPFLSHCCGSLKIDRMILYTSELTSQGAVHTPLTTAALANTEH